MCSIISAQSISNSDKATKNSVSGRKSIVALGQLSAGKHHVPLRFPSRSDKDIYGCKKSGPRGYGNAPEDIWLHVAYYKRASGRRFRRFLQCHSRVEGSFNIAMMACAVHEVASIEGMALLGSSLADLVTVYLHYEQTRVHVYLDPCFHWESQWDVLKRSYKKFAKNFFKQNAYTCVQPCFHPKVCTNR